MQGDSAAQEREEVYTFAGLALSRAKRAEDALRRCCDETDYCYLCNCHPSSGHGADCPLARPE